jgi:hypothetical protein
VTAREYASSASSSETSAGGDEMNVSSMRPS